jgi:trans-aconitate methyltransferase
MTLHEWGLFHKTDKATHHGYCSFYEARIGEPKSIVEFGVLNGASLKMWRDRYPKAHIFGVDIEIKEPIHRCNIACASCLTAPFFDMCDPDYRFDLIIDDASHIVDEQIKAFNLWWPLVNSGGHYIIEDIHTQHFTQYNPDKIDLMAWVKSLGIMYEEFWRNPEDKSDSGTIIFYKK